MHGKELDRLGPPCIENGSQAAQVQTDVKNKKDEEEESGDRNETTSRKGTNKMGQHRRTDMLAKLHVDGVRWPCPVTQLGCG